MLVTTPAGGLYARVLDRLCHPEMTTDASDRDHTHQFSLTSHLLNLASTRDNATFTRATQHEFLRLAGLRTLSKDRLERWLTQDNIYAFVGYPKFIAQLISRIPLRPANPSATKHGCESGPDFEERLLAILSSAMSNIVREIRFFRDTAQENGLDVLKPSTSGVPDDITNPITKGYVDLMIATGATGSILEGLTLLWVTEKCYLDAWTYAKSLLGDDLSSQPGLSRALETFINNWSTPEFKAFVDDIGAVLDEHVSRLLSVEGPKGLAKIVHSAENIWHWCLWYEERFWDGK